MYLPTHFAGSVADCAALLRTHPLGQWVLAQPGELSANPVPWLLHEAAADEGGTAWIAPGWRATADVARNLHLQRD